jgi:flagellar basal-body rod protein FlgG
LYTAAAGMLTQQRRHDAVTHNIANLNTPGYKAMTPVSRAFPDMLVAAIGGANPPKQPIGSLNTGVLAEENLLLLTQGALRETYRPLDLAIVSDIQVPGAVFDASGKYVAPDGTVVVQPQVFFTVLTPQGERYTRDGSFRQEPDGTLVTGDGMPVLGVDGEPIVVEESWDNVRVLPDGRLVLAQTGEPLPGNPQLLLTRVENPDLLVREGDGRYRHDGPEDNLTPLQPGDRAEVRQGYLERSNVDPAQSAVDLMAALRAYEANQKVIQSYDRSLEKAVNEVGRV